MNALLIKTNIQKEIWEYKKIFLWLPIIISILIILAPLISYIVNNTDHIEWIQVFERFAVSASDERFSELVNSMVSVLFVPFLIVSFFVQIYYFMACLFDERRDMSILFWRSLPVSDAMSVGVKLLVGALILPAFFMIAATITLLIILTVALIGCIILSVGYDISLWGFWGNSGVLGHVLSTWFNLLPYTLWLFPVYAWLMLISMASSKAPFLWAILPIILLIIIERIFVQYFGFNSTFFAGILLDYFNLSKGIVHVYSSQHGSVSNVPLNAIVDKINLIAIMIGAGFMYATYWLRANRSHS